MAGAVAALSTSPCSFNLASFNRCSSMRLKLLGRRVGDFSILDVTSTSGELTPLICEDIKVTLHECLSPPSLGDSAVDDVVVGASAPG